MLGTVTLQRIPPVVARRHPLRRVITRPRPKAVLRLCAPSQRNISSSMRRDVETGATHGGRCVPCCGPIEDDPGTLKYPPKRGCTTEEPTEGQGVFACTRSGVVCGALQSEGGRGKPAGFSTERGLWHSQRLRPHLTARHDPVSWVMSTVCPGKRSRHFLLAPTSHGLPRSASPLRSASPTSW